MSELPPRGGNGFCGLGAPMARIIVRAFVRKLRAGACASDAARQAAWRAGLVLPDGYTFIEPFLRSVSDGLRAAGSSSDRSSIQVGDDVPLLGTWVEMRYLLRWRDKSGRKHSRYISAHSGQKRRSGS